MKILPSSLKVKKMFGNPNYFEKSNLSDSTEEIYQEITYQSAPKSESMAPSTSTCLTGPAEENPGINFDDIDDDDQMLLSISEEDLNKTIEETKEARQLKELLKYLKEDLKQLNSEKLVIIKEIKPFENKLQLLQHKKFEIGKTTFTARKQLTEFNIELAKIEEKITELDKRIKEEGEEVNGEGDNGDK